MSNRGDIINRADCERLVRAFYGRAMSDAILGFLFVDVARLDLESHVPRITDFWETILLGAQRYSGGAFRPHAELAKSHADRVGRAFYQRIEAINGPPGAPGPMVVKRHGPGSP